MSESLNVTNRRVLVTGASSGIGAAIARKLHADGVEVVGLDRTAGGIDFPILSTDLSDRDRIHNTVASLEGSFTGLCNAAGLPGTAAWEPVLRVNYLGLRELTDALAAAMPSGSSVVNIASQAGYQVTQDTGLASRAEATRDWGELEDELQADPHFMDDPYGFTKHFVHQLTVARAAEWISRGVRCNSVSPGPVRTPIAADFRKQMGEERYDGAVKKVGRMGEPEDVADVVCFLLSDASRWINGVDIAADGGLSAVRRGAAAAVTHSALNR